VESPTSKRLNSVYFISADNGWAVGENGVILHWDGSEWLEECSPVDVELRAVQFLDEDNGWAAGDSEVVIHYDGVNWRVKYKGEKGTFTSLWFFDDTPEGWVSGHYIFHFYNDSCERDTSIDFYGCFYDMHFINSQKGWAVGEWAIDRGTGRGAVYCFDHNKWESVPIGKIAPLQNFWLSVFFISEDEGWIAGADDEIAGIEGAENMLHYKDGEWWVVNIDGYKTVYSLYFLTEKSGWAVGRKGYILKFQKP
ncbi:hypothetical protein DRQ20_07000, partial [bacterium]